jgi:homoserine kinase type II
MSEQSYELATLLAAWPVGATLQCEQTSTGSIHRVFRVLTQDGQYYLRAYRYADPTPIAHEHAVIAHVCARGVPAVAPLRARHGNTIHAANGRFFALFPAAPGLLVSDHPVAASPAALGAALAHMHRALADYPLEYVTRRTLQADLRAASDRTATLARLEHYARLVSAIERPSESDWRALRALERQREWIRSHRDAPHGALDTMAEQALHGDYNAANLFVRCGRVSAIIDWDQTYRASRAWEVIRSLDLLLDYDTPRCIAFICGYRAELALDLPELDQAALAYMFIRAHDLWKFAAVYEQGNERVRAFFAPEGFVDHGERWQAIRAGLRVANSARKQL